MPQTIDVTGLAPEAVRVIESLVVILREKATAPASTPTSVFDLFGKAAILRSGEDIAQQLQEEREGWGEP
jgi:hypothetical protein